MPGPARRNVWTVPLPQLVSHVRLEHTWERVVLARVAAPAGFVQEAPAAVVKRYLPWMWRALGVLLLSGLVLVWGEPDRSLVNQVFWLKMGMVVVAFVLTVLFRKPLLDPDFDAQSFDAQSAARAWSIKPLAWLSLSIWIAVVCGGRWIAYAG